jgi:hypothetical protein
MGASYWNLNMMEKENKLTKVSFIGALVTIHLLLAPPLDTTTLEIKFQRWMWEDTNIQTVAEYGSCDALLL